LAKEETTESEAQEVYEKTTQENKITKTTKDQDVKYKTQESTALDKNIGELSGDRDTASTELEAVLEYYSKIKELLKPNSPPQLLLPIAPAGFPAVRQCRVRRCRKFAGTAMVRKPSAILGPLAQQRKGPTQPSCTVQMAGWTRNAVLTWSLKGAACRATRA
jgi:hypothetical protein